MIHSVNNVKEIKELFTGKLTHGGSATVTTAGTAEALPDVECIGAWIWTKTANTGNIFIAVDSTVDNTDIPFTKSTLVKISGISNLNEIYIDVSVNGEGINYQPIEAA